MARTSKIEFFTDVDKNSHGRISSEYPAWMMDIHRENLKEGIGQKERALALGIESPDRRRQILSDVEKEKKRLYDIEQSKPVLSAVARDKVAAEYIQLKNRIAESMFSKYEQKEGLADAHEEARRMSQPCIEVDPAVAEACNVSVTGGKVSRTKASKIFKILGSYLGDTTNVEYLRPDRRIDI